MTNRSVRGRKRAKRKIFKGNDDLGFRRHEQYNNYVVTIT